MTNEEKASLVELLRSQKKYGLVWEDKPEEIETRLVDELPVLTEVPERAIVSESPDAPNHILIEGDNLEALTALAYTHEGKIDVIYIDPPYNTGNKDFVYNDSFVDREDGYHRLQIESSRFLICEFSDSLPHANIVQRVKTCYKIKIDYRDLDCCFYGVLL